MGGKPLNGSGEEWVGGLGEALEREGEKDLAKKGTFTMKRMIASQERRREEQRGGSQDQKLIDLSWLILPLKHDAWIRSQHKYLINCN